MMSRIHDLNDEPKGVVFAVVAHLFWGAMAGYFHLIAYVNPFEIAVHRALWSLPIGAFVVWKMNQVPAVWAIIKNPKLLALLLFTSLLVVFNWSLYVWCITHGHTLDASLGYFINPLMNVAVGFLFLGERFTRAQMLAIAIAIFAVGLVTIGTGVFPWIGLSLAATFCLYGYLRKVMAVGPIAGFLVEVALALIPLLAVDAWLAGRGELHFGQDAFTTLMLMGCGALTAGALLFYSASLKLIRYSTAGLMQYLSPSLVFLTAVFWFGERLDPWKLGAFGLIWLALAIYSWSLLQQPQAAVAS